MNGIISILVRILEAIFMMGLLGSAVVLILTLIEDAKSLWPGEDKKQSDANIPSRTSPAQPQFHIDPIA